MSAEEISTKTGIDQRRYTGLDIGDLALEAATAALAHSGRDPEEIGAVLVATCTSDRLIPSLSTWLSGELGLLQTHCSADIVAACAGLPYGLAEAIRQLQEVERPVLLVCVEKFSDKIGSVRTSRMIFGDGAAAIVVAPAPDGELGDVEVVQTYASGPVTAGQLDHLAEPGVRQRHHGLRPRGQGARGALPRADARGAGRAARSRRRGALAARLVELIVPHQANKTMILQLAGKAGLSADQLYFNIETMGNVSAASIPIAIFDAVRDKVITGPTRVFAPGFGAGAVGGYAVLTVDPAIVAPEVVLDDTAGEERSGAPAAATTSDDVRVAFGE